MKENQHSHIIYYISFIFLLAAVGLLMYSIYYSQDHKPIRQIVYPYVQSEQTKSMSNKDLLENIIPAIIENKKDLTNALVKLNTINTSSMSATLQDLEKEALGFTK